MRKNDFTMKPATQVVLSPDEVYFFYYDVMRSDLEDFPFDWNEKIEAFLKGKGIVAEVKKGVKLPDTCEKNILYLSVGSKDKGNKGVAFIRHLRNAFTHFHIIHNGEYLNIKDIRGKDITMIGQIKFEDLKELCYLFFDQKKEFGNKFYSEGTSLDRI